jgi:hypothetical protein
VKFQGHRRQVVVHVTTSAHCVAFKSGGNNGSPSECLKKSILRRVWRRFLCHLPQTMMKTALLEARPPRGLVRLCQPGLFSSPSLLSSCQLFFLRCITRFTASRVFGWTSFRRQRHKSTTEISLCVVAHATRVHPNSHWGLML